MTTPIRLGVIGCGAVVQSVHLPALARLPAFEIVALAEPDERRRVEAAAKYPRASTHSDWHKLVGNQNVQSVLIALPTGLHAECAVAAFDAGKHVYLEKPIATNRHDAERVVRAWRACGHVGMIGFNYRYSPLYAALRNEIASGGAGEVVAVRSVFSTTVAQVPSWKRSRATGGGVLLDLGSHHFDLLPHLVNSPICSVQASLRSVASEHDTVTVELTFANGLTAQSFFSLAAVEEDRVEIYGSVGKLIVDRYDSVIVEAFPARRHRTLGDHVRNAVRPLGKLPARLRKIAARGFEPSYVGAFQNFANAIRGEMPASPDLANALRSLLVVEAAERSYECGANVKLEPDELFNAPLQDCGAQA